jgi:hypothetical protein
MSAPAASLLIRRRATSAPVAVPVARVSAGSASLLIRRRAISAPIVPVGGSLDLSDQSPTTNLFLAYLASGGTFPVTAQLQQAAIMGGQAGTYYAVGSAATLSTLSRTATLSDTPTDPLAAHWYRAVLVDSAATPVSLATAGLLVLPLTIPDETAILRDVAARLMATGCFDQVMVSESADASPATSDWAAYASCWHKGGDDLDDAMSDGSPDTIRRATYGVMIEVADLESGDRTNELTRLVAKAKSALNHQSLAGATLPAWTMIRGDSRNSPSQPRGRATLSGEYAFISPADSFRLAYE